MKFSILIGQMLGSCEKTKKKSNHSNLPAFYQIFSLLVQILSKYRVNVREKKVLFFLYICGV